MKKLAIITTHPIQYYAPVFRLLAERQRIEIMVFYTWGMEAAQKFDPGFGKVINWDIPLLDGYPYEWVQNTAAVKGSHHFKGIQNPGLVRQLEFWQPEAVLIYGWAYQSHLKVMRHFKNKLPVYFRGDSTLIDETYRLKSQIKTWYLKWVYSHINHAFFTGTQSKVYFKKYGLREQQLTFTPHAIDNQRFSVKRTEEVHELRNHLKILNGALLIVFAGKFEEKKDPELLLKAFLALKRKDLHLLFIGNGTLEQSLKKTAQADAQVHFLNFQNQQYMPVVYQACDLFCLPSKGPGETWGLAVNEAMACSKPILVSDKVGCAVDLVKSECNGAIFKSGSSDSIALHLTALLDKGKEGLAQMGLHSKKIIDDWSIPAQVEAIESAVLKHG
ncbi:glycosyltransferase involved in cell wall biosynthesis [Pedobacter sp. AK017]|uniref:glycosyltransferase family 4 protein n=1 Tax=Pedobacter sp. AK017 TaxID=2723073 RepID=UPI0016208493|nr:glycosyltransferase family 4 protein [Pedobacter sp. AK017]MBB5438880.1 glycosyltransferase involved in cell wall biosynthesis [Pedobacter sp. AK017]